MGVLEVVINTCYGGFTLSDEAVKELQEMKNDLSISKNSFSLYPMCRKYKRHDLDLVEIIKRDSEKASGKNSELKIIKIDEIFVDLYSINEYDGSENIEINTKKLCQKLLTFDNLDDVKDLVTKVQEFTYS